MRIGIRFSKTGFAAYLSHLEIMRLFARALRRANVSVRYSQGFNPRIKMIFSTPSPIGLSSVAEYGEFEVVDEESINVMKERINAVLPVGVKILNIGYIGRGIPNLMECAKMSEYLVIRRVNSNADDVLASIKGRYERNEKISNRKGSFELRTLIQDLEIAEKDDKIYLHYFSDVKGKNAIRYDDIVKYFFGEERMLTMAFRLNSFDVEMDGTKINLDEYLEGRVE